MKKLAIYGAGGFGREVALMIEQINTVSTEWELMGFFDDSKKSENIDGYPVLGSIDNLNLTTSPVHLVITIADPHIRRNIVGQISNPNINFATLVHPRANIGRSTNVIGQGCIITAGCILTTGISIGSFGIVNLNSTIGHDCRLGDFVSIMPGVNISGNVRIGAESLIGTGAQILQNLEIGESCVVGAGAVVTRNVSNRMIGKGIPARFNPKGNDK